MLLIPSHTPTASVWRTTFGNEPIAYSEWDGVERLGPFIAIDTETDSTVDLRTAIQPLVVTSVSDGEVHRLLLPDALPRFLAVHHDHNFVMWNAAFDAHVICQAVGPLSSVLWHSLDQGRVWDSMLLEALLRLAETDADPHSESLDRVVRRRFGESAALDKSADSWRCRYHTLAGLPLADWPEAARNYAMLDAVATVRIFAQQWRELSATPTTHRHALAGPLSIFTQTRAAVALAAISRNGMAVDTACRDRSLDSLRDSIDSSVTLLEQLIGGQLFRRNKKTGEITRTKKTGTPSKNQATLVDVLSRVAVTHELDIPQTAKGRMSTSVKSVWRQYADVDPFIGEWISLEEAIKLQSFFSNVEGDYVRAQYRTMVRTGRTSCYGPNVQQLPRSGRVRDMFVPSHGHVFLACDFSYIELVTLAAICEKLYGFSRLADAIRAGYDPHAYAGAQLAGIPFEDFQASKGSDLYATWRQRAKAVNFGIPGGLSAQTLVHYAKMTYHVDMSLQEAEHFRNVHIRETYPELSHYLAEDGHAILAANLQTSPDEVHRSFPSDEALGFARRVVFGHTGSRDGTIYRPGSIAQTWVRLAKLNRNPAITIAAHAAGPELFRRLLTASVETLTGRVRANVRYTAARNTPFQGLAADGAKEAIYRLMRAGYRVCAFVHDEVLIELPAHGIDHLAAAEDVSRIMKQAMADIMQSSIPISTEFALMRRWHKGAKAVFDEAGRLIPWEPKQ